MSIDVKAKEPGFFETLRATGDRFQIETEEQLGKWMERQDSPKGEDVGNPFLARPAVEVIADVGAAEDAVLAQALEDEKSEPGKKRKTVIEALEAEIEKRKKPA